MKVLGIDVGGSGIKGAPVDTKKGKLLKSRHRIPTPAGAKPEEVAQVIQEIVDYFEWEQPFGCGFPAVVQRGVTRSAANVDDQWVGFDTERYLEDLTGYPVRMINDADAAGLAEMKFGAGKGEDGVVVLITVGTGLGTSLFSNGQLVPNTELGHLEIDGEDAEWNASDAARTRDDLSWELWAPRFDRYLRTIERLFWPDLIIIGGGASKKKKMKKYMPYMTVTTKVVPAQLRNNAGIIGAALAAKPVKKAWKKQQKK